MADIASKVQQIREARYGKDVRESIASGIEAINKEAEDAKASASASAEDAKTAHEVADAAAEIANQAAQNADEKAQSAARQEQISREGEQARTNAEQARAAAETERASAENNRKTAEASRVSAESKRASAESARNTAEQSRSDAENLRASAESARAAAETARSKAESGRDSAEKSRVQAESSRAAAESKRATSEASRESAETSRKTAENARASAENERATSEQGRVNAENARNVWEAYSASKSYVPGNKVVYNGSSYINITACKGVVPTDTEKWRLIAAKGLDGKGAGDMLASLYDPTGKGQDVYAYADAASQSVQATLDEQKVDKVTGKGLSTNDYTTAEKSKLAGIAEGANKTTVDSALSSTSTNPVQNKAAKAGIDAVQANLNAHTGNKSNPHGVTAAQAGAIPQAEKGTANGVAPLGADGKVPDGYLNAQGGLVAQAAAPENVKLGWIDTGHGNILKFYNGTAWTAVNAVWG